MTKIINKFFKIEIGRAYSIAGVAVAVTMGGPGALVWMVIAGLLGMALKFAEATLGVKYRKVNQFFKY